ncbi:MAG: uracil phosphoribosyltransferase [Fretibacterium sp.]|uniref:uracil phosphoribosyltransferase n=1 Tax=Fretibacterium sp. OH1220_COT-178 TaxID=2491047 RepID=UPI000F5E486F|nr:uracil phosphoribosyltransferase [Fretibacterium sp. OH1220_COT-178]MDO4785802.1 uracil phosphoribosyltransferase [Fretibacterium sp.]RRD64758.1 uracil phosphoribosyltransferase [Fretibacterium sp. OH1220_COT-178]
MNIAVGCDHAGFVLKSAVTDYLGQRPGVELLDFGTHSEDRVDYPDVALEVGRAVSDGRAACGVLLCGTGIGMAIAANKIGGVRAAACNDVESARMAKAHNDLNVIALGGRVIGTGQVPDILEAWLSTPFEGDRHLVRINKIAAAETATLSAELSSGGRVVVFNHPLVQHKVGIIRDKDTSVKEFRELVQEIAGLMVYEITRNLPLTEVRVETPLAVTTARTLEGKKLAILPVLRAGLGMVDGILQLVPNAKVGHIGLYRDPETLLPVEYYCKLPQDIEEREIFVLDPMLATGGSAAAAISLVKGRGGQKISLVCLIAAPEGIARVHEEHPEVDIFIAALDSHLNDHGYIVPGLGDAGDRLFGTK